MEIECLVCGYGGESRRVKAQIRPHWLYGVAEIDKLCPICGGTALEEVSTGKGSIVIHRIGGGRCG